MPNTNAFVPAGTIAAARWHYAGTAYDQRGSCGRAPDPGSLTGLSEEKAEQRLGCVHTESDSATKRIIFTETHGGRRFVWHLKWNLAQLFGHRSHAAAANHVSPIQHVRFGVNALRPLTSGQEIGGLSRSGGSVIPLRELHDCIGGF